MIFVTVGTSRPPFDRLVAAADRLAAAGERVIVQTGTSTMRIRHATSLDFVPFGALEEYVQSAQVVVSHAGVGSVALCLRHDRRPIVVPRLPQLGETIDGHQLAFARRLAELDVLTLVEDVAKLPDALGSARRPPRPTGLSSRLANELVAYISRYAASDQEDPPSRHIQMERGPLPADTAGAAPPAHSRAARSS